MKVTVCQRRSLAKLFEDAERIVEIYWNTNSGQELSQSPESARLAFGGLECIPRRSLRNNSPPRLSHPRLPLEPGEVPEIPSGRVQGPLVPQERGQEDWPQAVAPATWCRWVLPAKGQWREPRATFEVQFSPARSKSCSEPAL
jgi:hypothetical protein